MTQSAKIAVQNGLLDITTGKIEKFTKAEFVTNKLKTDFIEGTKSEAWEKFIEQVCPDDKLLLQEWSGYLLIKGYPFHAMMWLYGPKGRNGKGTWARTMESILGFENYSAVSIDEFDGKHRFAIFNLHDSLFNICSEPRTDKTLTVEMLQSLTGMDALDAERKGVQERFKFFNPAKMTVMGNKFPNVDKPTDAFWERLKLIKFPYTFTGDSQIQEIEKTWLDDPQQRAGILNWMIEGALRLLKNHGFTLTTTQEETVIQFKRASDSIGAFIAECIEFDAKEYTTKVNAFEFYKTYCEVINVIADTLTAFNKKLNDTSKIKDTSTRIGLEKKKTKVWKGFKLKSLPEEAETEEPEEENDETKPKTEQKTLLDSKSGTGGTTGTIIIPEEKSEYNILDISKKVVPSVPSVPSSTEETSQLTVITEESGLRRIEPSKPTFYVKDVPSGEKCDCCGKFAVSKEIVTPQGDTIRRCEQCLKDLQLKFPGANFKQAYAEMPSFDDKAQAGEGA